jgi:hypothetical protein
MDKGVGRKAGVRGGGPGLRKHPTIVNRVYEPIDSSKEMAVLLEFTVGNFRSFKDPVTLSMAAADIESSNRELDEENTSQTDDGLCLLKTAALYGANASGKSNFIRAMAGMRRAVVNFALGSVKDSFESGQTFKLDSSSEFKPHYFEAEFVLDHILYRYGFECDNKKVFSEWLYAERDGKESELFSRNGSQISISDNFDRQSQGLEEKTRHDRLFLAVVSEFNGPIAMKIKNWFENIKLFHGVDNPYLEWEGVKRYESETFRDKILDLIKRTDVGIDNIRVEQIPVPEDEIADIRSTHDRHLRTHWTPGKLFTKKIYTYHKKRGGDKYGVELEEFELKEHESDGTQRLFGLAGVIFGALDQGGVIFIDELDVRLHPLMTVEIIKLFHSGDTNPNNAQLIFTTHDSNLLDEHVFRADQIWFLEKDKFGASRMYSLVEYKMDKCEFTERDYLRGKYGGIPHIIERKLKRVEVDGEKECKTQRPQKK